MCGSVAADVIRRPGCLHSPLSVLVIVYISHVNLYFLMHTAQVLGMNPRPTIQDVARIAGVSTATVSRALHDSTRVTGETAARVHAAVKSTGYTLNTAARTLRIQRANALLVVVPDIGNTFYGEVLAGIEHAAQGQGQTILIADTGGDPAREAAYLAHLRNGRADGAILMLQPDPGWDAVARVGAMRPLVMISEEVVSPDIGHVHIDNRRAARDATDHLIACGHRRILNLQGPKETSLTAARHAGYRDALAAAGIAFDPHIVLTGDYGVDSGAAAGQALVAMPDRPTAAFCDNDEMAMGLIGAVTRAGLSVPRDLSVVGFDDIHFARCIVPALTTIHQPRRAMGEAAVSVLNAILTGQPGTLRRVMPHDLVLRASTAPLHRAGGLS
jgi:LacI family transcriptional regulator, repressor for deo operon, udp, cdd, tsx, nupC, and nupG